MSLKRKIKRNALKTQLLGEFFLELAVEKEKPRKPKRWRKNEIKKRRKQ